MRSFPALPALPSRLLLVPSLAAALAGCTWISDKDVEERLAVVDDDGDGFAAAKDCNDADATVNPRAAETFYDGVDSDCGGDDDYDADDDGFVPDAYVGLTTGGVDGSGALPGGDCDDADATVLPGAVEVFHDGVDQDCAEDDDYDQDLDGFVADADVGKPTTGVAGSGALPGGDCDDTAADANPDAPDADYDGVDSDCAGNDDYDLDADGHADVAHAESYGPTVYVDGSGALPADDCDDADATIFPAAPDAWYDGIDSNCDTASDFDADADGYDIAHADVSEADGDCDDRNADVHPDGHEKLGDEVDTDCDGGVDRFALGSAGGVTWTAAHDPEFAVNSDHIFLSAPDAQLTHDGHDYWDSAAAIAWSSASPYAEPTVYLWNSNTDDPDTFSVGAGQGFAVTDDYIYGVLSLDLSGGHGLRFVRYNLSAGTRNGVNVQNSGSDVTPYTDLSFAVSGDSLYAAGADTNGNLTFARVDDITSGDAAVNHEESAGADRVGMVPTSSLPIYATVADELLGYSFDAAGAEEPFSASVLDTGVSVDDLDTPYFLDRYWRITASSADSQVTIADLSTGGSSSFRAAGVTDISVTWSEDSSRWFAAWADDHGDAHLSYGSGLALLSTLDWDLPGTRAQVAVGALGGHVWMAVAADGVVTVGQVEE